MFRFAIGAAGLTTGLSIVMRRRLARSVGAIMRAGNIWVRGLCVNYQRLGLKERIHDALDKRCPVYSRSM